MTGACRLTAQGQAGISLVHMQVRGINVDQADGTCKRFYTQDQFNTRSAGTEEPQWTV